MQILLNFLSNSLKFTNENGCIKVEIKVVTKQLIHKSNDIRKKFKNIGKTEGKLQYTRSCEMDLMAENEEQEEQASC